MTLLRTARVFASLGDDVLLFFSMDGNESLGQAFEYEVELLSTDEQLDLTKLLGQPMVVALELPNLQFREFTGYVTRFVLVGTLGRYVRYRATLRPWLWMLTRRSNCRIFQNKTVPQVIMALFREHGFSDFEDKLSAEYRTWEYLVQYRESDFNFVSRMMEQEGSTTTSVTPRVSTRWCWRTRTAPTSSSPATRSCLTSPSRATTPSKITSIHGAPCARSPPALLQPTTTTFRRLVRGWARSCSLVATTPGGTTRSTITPASSWTTSKPTSR